MRLFSRGSASSDQALHAILYPKWCPDRMKPACPLHRRRYLLRPIFQVCGLPQVLGAFPTVHPFPLRSAHPGSRLCGRCSAAPVTTTTMTAATTTNAVFPSTIPQNETARAASWSEDPVSVAVLSTAIFVAALFSVFLFMSGARSSALASKQQSMVCDIEATHVGERRLEEHRMQQQYALRQGRQSPPMACENNFVLDGAAFTAWVSNANGSLHTPSHEAHPALRLSKAFSRPPTHHARPSQMKFLHPHSEEGTGRHVHAR